MSSRTVVLIAASVALGLACMATASTEVFARAAAGTSHHHHYRHPGAVHHSGLAHPRWIAAEAPPSAGFGLQSSPYCWPYDYAYDPAQYCGASYIVSW